MAKQYEIHKLLLTKLMKIAGKKEKKVKKGGRGAFISLLSKITPDFRNTLDFTIMAEEAHWQDEGHNIVFPDSAEMLHKLYNAKYDMDGPAGFDLPFESFMVAIPKGFEIDGIKIPSFLVTYLPYIKTDEVLFEKFCDEAGIPRPIVNWDHDAEDEVSINITYQEVGGDSSVHFMKFVSELPAILKANTLDEFREIVPDVAGKKSHALLMDDLDIEVQFRIVKLIASLGVYHVATEGQRLKAGFPSGDAIKMDRQSGYKPTIYSMSSPKVERTSPGEHVRGWTFRQLRDERYYKGEHANKKPGSRWVFVDSYTVGTKATAHTQE